VRSLLLVTLLKMTDVRYPIGRLDAYSERYGQDQTDYLKQMAIAPSALRSAVEGLSSAQLETPYRQGGWSLRQIVHHLADSQINWYVRTKLALTEESPTIKPFDADRWSELIDGCTRDIEPSLVLLSGLYERWVPLLASLTPEEWSRRLYHPERGWLSLAETLPMHAWHGQHHTAQITELVKRMRWNTEASYDEHRRSR
jgi:uncharacterized damage-inducible protein DinB